MTNSSPTISPAEKLAALALRIGEELGKSDWISIDQGRIDDFAKATDDHQWIHVDPARAASEGPFGGTIGHGFLSLALIAPTLFEVLIDPLQVRQAINYGLEQVRFIAPVKAGKRVRNCITLLAVQDRGRGRWMVTTQNSFEIEGEGKPALTAQNLVLLSV
ncbi:MaoC family dehydratase [Pseudomonas sp. N040]|uniref:MaoC family dehydratase n=1 Tax=Pseudomonas sp. N040 TaxID=2785325 RepID=UPI001E5227DF|nr:MaoC family dehydratase [Pseudomonas sp. N040]